MNEALDRAARAARLLVACDFDGTLSHLVDRPGDARPAPGTIEALAALEALPGTTVAIVSGRQRDVLRTLTGAPESLVLVGSHGAELGELDPEPSDTRRLDDLETDLHRLAEGHPGAHVERKPGSVAFHLRRLESPSPDLDRSLERIVSQWDGRVIRGKDVVEWSIHDASKGDAITHLRASSRADMVLYAGDDVTDEDAFAVLGEQDLGIKVGEGDTMATHRLESPAEMAELLQDLAVRRAAHGGQSGDHPISR